MGSGLRKLVHFAIPSEFHDPIGLAGRVLRSGPEGRFAVFSAVLGVVATPIDLLASVAERRVYRRAGPPTLPMLLICGPPRSGTTVVALTIARAISVAYFTNLTSVFPRAPITMSRLFRARPEGDRLSLRSHYGRTADMFGWNDGLHLWDRWLGRDRTATDARIAEAEGSAMQRFFGAFEQWSDRPLVNKNNGLIFCAPQLARFLPTATFLCLRREPLYLAQSLLVARSYIHGNETIPYGRDDSARLRHADPVADVCEQVRYYELLTERCRHEIGPERFRVTSYEDFCENPSKLVHEVARNLDVSVNPDRIPQSLPVSTRQTVPDATFERLRRLLEFEEPG